MLEDKQIKEIEKKVPLMFNEGGISKEDKNKNLLDFYQKNAEMSLNTAKILMEVSTNASLKNQFKFVSNDFQCNLWVINTSYYSMFYIANALLATRGIKIAADIGVHKKTFEALVYYFYLTKEIAKHLLEEFKEAQDESQELLATEQIMQEKAKKLIEKYNYERGKRVKFTYQMTEEAKQNKALTSLNRAGEFNREIKKLIEKKVR